MSYQKGQLRIFAGLAVTFALFSAVPALAQDEAALAETVQNPIADIVTLPIQVNWNTNVGDFDRTAMNMNIQPVVPFSAGDDWNVITRTIIPVNSVPIGETLSEFGVGDVTFSAFWTPKDAGNLVWGVGPAVVLPTASNGEVLGSEKLSIGPTGVIFYSTGNWTMGAVANNVWSIAGEDDRDDVNFFFMQYFLNYNLGKGLAIGTAPIVTANWEADSDNRWTIPWGLQISKVTKLGKQPVNLLFGYYKNSEHPEDGADGQVRFQINFIWPQ